ncbi:DNA primase [Weissella viridescens]|uniref:DNA primase n=1 Tax=Weissella viridescens TaxID=1629 RepID=A0A380P8Z8_WEIVI|nr:DNA primase [Weissella viridescens]
MPTRIPEDVVTEIRERVNIVDVISPYVPLKKQGRNLFGVCPFHEERTPSFQSMKTSKFSLFFMWTWGECIQFCDGY